MAFLVKGPFIAAKRALGPSKKALKRLNDFLLIHQIYYGNKIDRTLMVLAHIFYLTCEYIWID